MDNVQIRTQLTASFLAVYGCAGDGNRIASFVELFKDVPVEILRAAYDKVLLESEKIPVPAMVYKAVKDLTAEQNGTKYLTWAEAWKEIDQQIVENGIYSAPHFTRPEIAEAVKAYGWRNLCETLTKDMDTARAQLRNMYYDICKRKDEQIINGYVLGNNKLLENKVKLIGKKCP